MRSVQKLFIVDTINNEILKIKYLKSNIMNTTTLTIEQQSILTAITNIQSAMTRQNKISADNCFSFREKDAAIQKAFELNKELSEYLAKAKAANIERSLVSAAIVAGF